MSKHRHGPQTELAVKTHAFSGKSLGAYPDFVKALLRVKTAAARANRLAGVLTPSECSRVVSACAKLAEDFEPELYPVDVLQGGGGIGIHSNINEAVAAAAGRGIDPLRHVNASQSTVDVLATALRLTLSERGASLAAELERSRGFALEKAAEFASIRTLSRTCLRDAAPTNLGKGFAAFAALLERRTAALQAAFAALRQVNLGGTVIGDGAGAPPAYRTRVLGELQSLESRPIAHRKSLYDAAQHSDDLGAAAAELKLIAQAWIKFAKDLRLLSSGPKGGFGELNLPKVLAGSSFFRDKINPTIPETLLQACFHALGLLRAVEACVEHAELDLNVFDTAAGIQLYDAAAALRNAVKRFNDHCLQGITANSERCEELVQGAQPYGHPDPVKN